MINPDRTELQVAAVIGVVLGVGTGYLLGHGWLDILIWGLIGAVVVSGLIYCLRAFR
jgi:membrane-associated phospholipid phosphatase